MTDENARVYNDVEPALEAIREALRITDADTARLISRVLYGEIELNEDLAELYERLNKEDNEPASIPPGTSPQT